MERRRIDLHRELSRISRPTLGCRATKIDEICVGWKKTAWYTHGVSCGLKAIHDINTHSCIYFWEYFAVLRTLIWHSYFGVHTISMASLQERIQQCDVWASWAYYLKLNQLIELIKVLSLDGDIGLHWNKLLWKKRATILQKMALWLWCHAAIVAASAQSFDALVCYMISNRWRKWHQRYLNSGKKIHHHDMARQVRLYVCESHDVVPYRFCDTIPSNGINIQLHHNGWIVYDVQQCIDAFGQNQIDRCKTNDQSSR